MDPSTSATKDEALPEGGNGPPHPSTALPPSTTETRTLPEASHALPTASSRTRAAPITGTLSQTRGTNDPLRPSLARASSFTDTHQPRGRDKPGHSSVLWQRTAKLISPTASYSLEKPKQSLSSYDTRALDPTKPASLSSTISDANEESRWATNYLGLPPSLRRPTSSEATGSTFKLTSSPTATQSVKETSSTAPHDGLYSGRKRPTQLYPKDTASSFGLLPMHSAGTAASSYTSPPVTTKQPLRPQTTSEGKSLSSIASPQAPTIPDAVLGKEIYIENGQTWTLFNDAAKRLQAGLASNKQNHKSASRRSSPQSFDEGDGRTPMGLSAPHLKLTPAQQEIWATAQNEKLGDTLNPCDGCSPDPQKKLVQSTSDNDFTRDRNGDATHYENADQPSSADDQGIMEREGAMPFRSPPGEGTMRGGAGAESGPHYVYPDGTVVPANNTFQVAYPDMAISKFAITDEPGSPQPNKRTLAGSSSSESPSTQWHDISPEEMTRATARVGHHFSRQDSSSAKVVVSSSEDLRIGREEINPEDPKQWTTKVFDVLESWSYQLDSNSKCKLKGLKSKAKGLTIIDGSPSEDLATRQQNIFPEQMKQFDPRAVALLDRYLCEWNRRSSKMLKEPDLSVIAVLDHYLSQRRSSSRELLKQGIARALARLHASNRESICSNNAGNQLKRIGIALQIDENPSTRSPDELSSEDSIRLRATRSPTGGAQTFPANGIHKTSSVSHTSDDPLKGNLGIPFLPTLSGLESDTTTVYPRSSAAESSDVVTNDAAAPNVTLPTSTTAKLARRLQRRYSLVVHEMRSLLLLHKDLDDSPQFPHVAGPLHAAVIPTIGPKNLSQTTSIFPRLPKSAGLQTGLSASEPPNTSGPQPESVPSQENPPAPDESRSSAPSTATEELERLGDLRPSSSTKRARTRTSPPAKTPEVQISDHNSSVIYFDPLILVLGATTSTGMEFVRTAINPSPGTAPLPLMLYVKYDHRIPRDIRKHNNLRIHEGTLTDKWALFNAMSNVDIVISFLRPKRTDSLLAFLNPETKRTTTAIYQNVFQTMRMQRCYHILVRCSAPSRNQSKLRRQMLEFGLRHNMVPRLSAHDSAAIGALVAAQHDLGYTVMQVPKMTKDIAELHASATMNTNLWGDETLTRASFVRWILSELRQMQCVKKTVTITNMDRKRKRRLFGFLRPSSEDDERQFSPSPSPPERSQPPSPPPANPPPPTPPPGYLPPPTSPPEDTPPQTPPPQTLSSTGNDAGTVENNARLPHVLPHTTPPNPPQHKSLDLERGLRHAPFRGVGTADYNTRKTRTGRERGTVSE